VQSDLGNGSGALYRVLDMIDSKSVNKVISIEHRGKHDRWGSFQLAIAHAGGTLIKTVYGREAALFAASTRAKLGQHVRVKDLTNKEAA